MRKTALGERRMFSYISGVWDSRKWLGYYTCIHVYRFQGCGMTCFHWSLVSEACGSCQCQSNVPSDGSWSDSLPGPPVSGRLTNHGTFPLSHSLSLSLSLLEWRTHLIKWSGSGQSLSRFTSLFLLVNLHTNRGKLIRA